jgi:hypothetical protein
MKRAATVGAVVLFAAAGCQSDTPQPTGTVVISDSTPVEGQVLTATPAFDDADSIHMGTLHWQVQVKFAPWEDVASGATFVPGNDEVGKRLRVEATFQDADGTIQVVTSQPTARVEPEEVVPPLDPRVPNVTRLDLQSARFRLKIAGPWHVVVKKRATTQESPGNVLQQRPRPARRLAEGRRVVLMIAERKIVVDDPNCQGYDPCIPPGPDVDCAGGTGDGPRFVSGPVRVNGSDPYGLDGDGDGWGCE